MSAILYGSMRASCELITQRDTDTYAFDESRLLMIPAEGTDRIDDLIHTPQGNAVHGLVQRMEVVFDFVIVQGVGFAVGLV